MPIALFSVCGCELFLYFQSADYDRLVQISPGSKIKFKEIDLSDAETLFKLYEMETQNLISQI